nr:hypothetical protein [Escherichia coli]
MAHKTKFHNSDTDLAIRLVRDLAGEKSLATSDVSGILNAPALNPLRRVLFFSGILVYNSHVSLNT